ncbi:MAG: DUF2779 domain-containing protein [Gammaproteobacteria bacterium]
MLTKSHLLSARQCPRQLWLNHHRPDLIPRDHPATWRRANDGRIVGERARAALGPGVWWPPGNPDPVAAAATALEELRANPATTAVEFPAVAGPLYIRADTLIPVPGGYLLSETKAKTFPLKKDKVTPDKPEDHLVDDVAIQLWTLTNAGVPVPRAELNLLDGRWRYPGNGDYRGLFRTLDVTGEARVRTARVPAWVAEAEAILAGPMPAVATGSQCRSPHVCPFITFCRPLDPPGPEHPLDLLPDTAGKNLARKLHAAKGYTSLLEPEQAELTGKQAPLYRRMQRAHRTGTAIREAGSRQILAAYPYPRYYLDFEAIDLAVPRWPGVRPYEHIPFQWSCHIERAPGVFEHAEFLDLSGEDPSRVFAAALAGTIDARDGGPIFVYNATYERLRLNELAERHPDVADAMHGYAGRLVDLLPLVRDHYYHPAMRGSFSIKKVLPVVAPDLDYGELDEVQEGTGAQVAYLYAALDPAVTPARRADLETKLRRYCQQDTWAMVEIAHFLAEGERPRRPAGG